MRQKQADCRRGSTCCCMRCRSSGRRRLICSCARRRTSGSNMAKQTERRQKERGGERDGGRGGGGDDEGSESARQAQGRHGARRDDTERAGMKAAPWPRTPTMHWRTAHAPRSRQTLTPQNGSLPPSCRSAAALSPRPRPPATRARCPRGPLSPLALGVPIWSQKYVTASRLILL